MASCMDSFGDHDISRVVGVSTRGVSTKWQVGSICAFGARSISRVYDASARCQAGSICAFIFPLFHPKLNLSVHHFATIRATRVVLE